MDQFFIDKLYAAHQACVTCPSPGDIVRFYKTLLGILFADTTQLSHLTRAQFDETIDELKKDFDRLLQLTPPVGMSTSAVTGAFFGAIPALYDQLQQDVTAMYLGDPAAQSTSEVVRSYPGFYAIAAYRFAHELQRLGVDNIPRIITEHAHSKTGIDIHPGATIGNRFCIDHGTGIVIGETTIIGDHVKIYQGVTLGALSVNKEDAKKKRHPTIEDNVVLYAGASILGGETVIGHDSVIGGNVWLTRSIPPYSKVYYQSRMYHVDSDKTDLVIVRNH
jgi:serine O-acetyltransferase